MLPAHQMDLITSGFVPSRRAMGAAAVFDGVDLLPSGHGIPTDRCQVPPCVPCADDHSPFLVACNWDGAGRALQWMLGGGRALTPRAGRPDPHGWSYFDQVKYRLLFIVSSALMAIITSDFIDGPNHFALSNLKLQRNFVMRGQHQPSARLAFCCTPPLPLVGVSIGMERECQ